MACVDPWPRLISVEGSGQPPAAEPGRGVCGDDVPAAEAGLACKLLYFATWTGCPVVTLGCSSATPTQSTSRLRSSCAPSFTTQIERPSGVVAEEGGKSLLQTPTRRMVCACPLFKIAPRHSHLCGTPPPCPVGLENWNWLCCLGVFVDQPAKDRPSHDARSLVARHIGRRFGRFGRSLLERPVRAVLVVVRHIGSENLIQLVPRRSTSCPGTRGAPCPPTARRQHWPGEPAAASSRSAHCLP